MIDVKDIGGMEAVKVALPNANLILVKAAKGYLMCGYLNLDAAEKLGDVACVVTGVKEIEDALNARVVKLTCGARKLGVKEGMSGWQALKIMG